MQDRIHLTPGNPPVSSLLPGSVSSGAVEPPAEETSFTPAPTEEAKPEASTFDQSLTALGEMLDEHKGKLAIGAAAMLGLMVYYKWGEKSLAKEDPEEYQRLQRIKNRVRHADLGEPAPSGATNLGRRAGDKNQG